MFAHRIWNGPGQTKVEDSLAHTPPLYSHYIWLRPILNLLYTTPRPIGHHHRISANKNGAN